MNTPSINIVPNELVSMVEALKYSYATATATSDEPHLQPTPQLTATPLPDP